MQNFVLDLTEISNEKCTINTCVSFGPFVEYLKERAAKEKTVKKNFYEFVLDEFSQYPQLLNATKVEEMVKHKELLEFVYAILVPAISDENSTLWALSQPMTPVIFYGTDGFYSLISDGETHLVKTALIKSSIENKEKSNNAFIYTFLLRKLYNFNFFFKEEMVHSIRDEESGVMKYYRMDLDDRFIKITPKKPLPEINLEDLQVNAQEIFDFAVLEDIMPLDMFSFEGIAVLTLIEVTEQYALETIKNIILSHHSGTPDYDYTEVVAALKTLVGNDDIEFGLLPMFKVNNKLVFNDETCLNSILIGTARKHGMAEQAYMTVAERYFDKPKPLLFKTITPDLEASQVFLKMLKQIGVKSYALLPVFYNEVLCGVVEVFTKVEGLLNESFFTKLESAIPLLGQLLRNSIDSFDASLDMVIRDKFTSLQPAVQWKFNEAAWQYLQDTDLINEGKAMEPIVFKTVYPLYGAIDIRNSTAERANALIGDMQTRFKMLIDTLLELKKKLPLSIIDEKIFLAKKWEQGLVDFSYTTNDVELNIYLENEMRDFLNHFKKHSPEAALIVDKYMFAISNEQGDANHNRKELEVSIELINKSINNYLENVKASLQEPYPCYFEKYRSDGVEYDIYIGQSIAPDKPFNLLYFHNLRLWQLQSMAEIARLTNNLLPKMKRQLQTTQLIFIHPDTIDISFRTDERRFDVEGAYNIRYQVIKKRIDKVCIKDSQERLTQPGKIAMVYFNDNDAEEYAKYVQYLQNQQVLLNDTEYLELENLQGVSGLKAIRVGVNFDFRKETPTPKQKKQGVPV